MTGFSGLAVGENADAGDMQWAGVPRILGPAWVRLPSLTIGLLGVQVLWSVEMSYATPYLLSLGLSKSLVAVAYLAGPLSGLLVQPLIGAIADNSKSRFGRRRPYMLLGTVICSVSMLLLGFTRDVVSIIIPRGTSLNDTVTIILAVVALYGIDFSVNAVQAVDRALIVDSIPFSEQPDGNAWAARMLGLGSVVGFFMGNLDLSGPISVLGQTQLEVLSVLSVLLLTSSQMATAVTVKEKILISSSRPRTGLRQEIREIWNNILALPPIIRQICFIQFLAWFAWFPFVFYTTLYVGDLYKASQPVPTTDDAASALDAQATILGTRAFFHYSLVALAANFLLPLFVKGENDGNASTFMSGKAASFAEKMKVVNLCDLWTASHFLFAACMAATFFVSTVSGATVLITLVGFSWALTQWAPFSLLAEEILSSSNDVSFNDAVSIRLQSFAEDRDDDVVWDEAHERQRLMEETPRMEQFAKRGNSSEGRASLAGADDDDDPSADISIVSSRAASLDRRRSPRPSREALRANGNLLGNGAARQSHLTLHESLNPDDDIELAARPQPSGLQAKSGVIIGIHNLFIVIPQFLSTGLTSLIFALVDPAKSSRAGHSPGGVLPPPLSNNATAAADAVADSLRLLIRAGDEEAMRSGNSVAIVFRIGGITAFMAGILCWRLSRQLKKGR